MQHLNYYIKHAQACIKTWGVPDMLKSEDDISYVAQFIMTADSIWDGRGDEKAFMNQYAKYAIMNLIRKFKADKKRANVYIHEKMDLKCDESPPDEQVENSELVEHILNAEYLLDNEKKCLTEKYLYNRTMREIGKIIGISHEMVRQHINSAIKKVRRYYNE